MRKTSLLNRVSRRVRARETSGVERATHTEDLSADTRTHTGHSPCPIEGPKEGSRRARCTTGRAWGSDVRVQRDHMDQVRERCSWVLVLRPGQDAEPSLCSWFLLMLAAAMAIAPLARSWQDVTTRETGAHSTDVSSPVHRNALSRLTQQRPVRRRKTGSRSRG